MKETEEELIQEFEMFDDWMDKYNYIIELGKDLPMIDPQYKTEEYLIADASRRFGCTPRCATDCFSLPPTATLSSRKALSIC